MADDTTNNQPEEDKHLEPQPPKQPNGEQIQINLDAAKTPILYSDLIHIYTNDAGVVLNFGQSVGPVPTQNIVSRVGLSHTHAKEMYEKLGENLRQYFNAKGMEF
jgi:hypothetical protein